MLECLEKAGIPFDPTSKKETLLAVITLNKLQPVYAVERLCQHHGVEVLRIPPYHCVLNPIELAWSQLKETVRKRNTKPSDPSSVVGHVRNVADLVTSDMWKKFVNHVKKCENEMRYCSRITIDESLKNIVPFDDSDDDL